ncbi:MAG: hypothetical protein U0637_07425 [Phycisphaerales bacterium]
MSLLHHSHLARRLLASGFTTTAFISIACAAMAVTTFVTSPLWLSPKEWLLAAVCASVACCALGILGAYSLGGEAAVKRLFAGKSPLQRPQRTTPCSERQDSVS